MSTELLYDTYTEVKRLMIAGSALCHDDFRIKRLIPKLNENSNKATVFARVYAMVKELSECNTEESSSKLLELSSFLLAVLATLCETKPKGESQKPEFVNTEPKCSQSFRKVQPVMEALSEKSSGRLNIIKAAREEKLFGDIRLIPYLISALSESNAEISSEIEGAILDSEYNLVPLLMQDLDLKGGSEHVKRVKLLCYILGNRGKDFYYDVAENGNTKMQVYALEAMGQFSEFEDYLIKTSESKNKDISQAALTGLSKINSTNAKNKIISTFKSKNYSSAINALKNIDFDIDNITDEAKKAIEFITKLSFPYDNDDLKEIQYSVQLLYDLADILSNKKDSKAIAFAVYCLEVDSKKLANAVSANLRLNLIEKLLDVLKYNESYDLLEKYGIIYKKWGLGYAFYASYFNNSPPEVYKKYGNILNVKNEESQLIVSELLKFINSYSKFETLSSGKLNNLFCKAKTNFDKKDVFVLDEQWIHIFIKVGYAEFICPFLNAQMNDAINWLVSVMQSALSYYVGVKVIEALKRVGYKNIDNIVLVEIEKWLNNSANKNNYNSAMVSKDFYTMFPDEFKVKLMEIAQKSTSSYISSTIINMLKKDGITELL